MTNFIQKTHLDIGFSDFHCLLDSQCSLLTSQILGRCIKLKWSNRAYAVYWLCGTLLCPWAEGVEGAEEDEGDAIFILLDGYDTMGIGYMALWGFRAKCGTGVDG